MSECYLETKGIDHSKIPELYLRQFYFVAKLFPHKKICSWCLNKLQDGVGALDIDIALRQQFVNVDTPNADQWKIRNPQYAKLISKLGVEFVKTELKRNIFEIPFEARIVETLGKPLNIKDDSGEVRTITEEEWERKRLHITVD